MNYPIPILLYHRIEDTPASTATPPEVFRQHLELLKDQGWKSLSSDEFAYYMQSGRMMPVRSFLITFDDGHQSVRAVAFDILKELDFKAINFVCTKYLRGAAHGESAPLSQEDAAIYLSWDQVREMQESGIIDNQSHSHSHTRFDHWKLADIRRDLEISMNLLTQELRLPASHFTHLAWPWGLSNQKWRVVAASLGFEYQYNVARLACPQDCMLENIPRICFDGSTLDQFQLHLWLQTGSLSPVWNIAYPIGRTLRKFVKSVNQ